MPPQPFDATIDERAGYFHNSSTELLLGTGLKNVADLGIYRFQLNKQERVSGKILPEQVMIITIREEPFAVKVQNIDGPGKGRLVLYNSLLRKRELRVREAGLFGIFGALWISTEGSLVVQDTNHRVTELGFAAVLKMLQSYLKQAAPFGGVQRHDEGWNEQGDWCIRFNTPREARLYASMARICLEPRYGLPIFIENEDEDGFRERFKIHLMEERMTLGGTAFTPAGAGL